MDREHHDGACNEPRPWNWREACKRVWGHAGPHWSEHDRRHAFWEGTREQPHDVTLGQIVERASQPADKLGEALG